MTPAVPHFVRPPIDRLVAEAILRGESAAPDLDRAGRVLVPRTGRVPWTRRAILQAGLLGPFGLGLTQLVGRTTGQALAASEGAIAPTPAQAGFGQAKACILIFLWGGPSHLDTWDPKPLAPETIRSPFRPIATTVSGMELTEHFGRLAGVAERFALIRSLSHDDPAHLSSVHTLLTGNLPPVNKSDDVPPSDRDTPHIGSLLSRLLPSANELPSYVNMPWIVSHPAAPGGRAPGQHGGWLGHRYDPLVVTGDPSQPDWRVPALQLYEGETPDRLLARRRLLEQLDQQRRTAGQPTVLQDVTAQQAIAFDLLHGATARGAFDLSQEPAAVRDRYGRNLHGQCVLLARRLIEHGVRLVSVNWHNDGQSFWDTHGNNFQRLEHDLIPPTDQALSTLLDDLADRGLLDETLVICVGEFGRRPKITTGNAGREHHPWCYSGLLAGGGIQGGQVYGSSDSHGFYPASFPTKPQSIVATALHALGVPADTTLLDNQGRPHAVASAPPLTSLFG